MIINQMAALELATRELYMQQGIELCGMGFIGMRQNWKAGLSSKPASLSYIENSNFGSYLDISIGWFVNCVFGNYCNIAEGVKINKPYNADCLTTSPCSTNSDPYSPIFANFKGRQNPPQSLSTYIGHDVCIGSNVQISEGVCIGHGAIVKAGSVVKQHIPPFAVVEGDKAKIIKMRFPEAEIERILKSAWYTYDWSNIEVDWGNRQNCLSQMEDLIASGKVPQLSLGYAYQASESGLQVNPASWTFEKQLQHDFQVQSISELFASQKILENMVH